MFYFGGTQNRNAVIRNRVLKNGSLRTETARRDAGIEAKASTNKRNNSSRLTLNVNGTTVKLSGREMRTLFRVLTNHYDYTDKSLSA